MPSPYDVIVVGSGPAGGTAARYAARRGLKVLLVDKRKEIGVPVQCGEYVAHNEEMRSIFPDVEGLEDLMSVPYHVREVDTPVIRIWSPKGRRYEVPFFFFSSRRRHTRWTGDWSSDVCSSDLDHQARGRRGEPPWRGFARGDDGHGDRDAEISNEDDRHDANVQSQRGGAREFQSVFP